VGWISVLPGILIVINKTHERIAINSGHAVNTTYMDVGSADIAGENICHPCTLDTRIPAADGLELMAILFICIDSISYRLLLYNCKNSISDNASKLVFRRQRQSLMPAYGDG